MPIAELQQALHLHIDEAVVYVHVQAMAAMEERNIRHMPVFDGERLLGMLSIKDIVSTFMEQHDSDMSSMSDYIAGGSY